MRNALQMIGKTACGMAAAGAVLLPALAHAQDTAVDAADAVSDSGDTALILVAAAGVLVMTLAGLGLFYGGRMAQRNLLSLLVQIGGIVAAVSLAWIAVGYTLAFGAVGSGWIGGGNAWMLIALGDVRDGTTIPESGFALFETTIAAFAAALMAGAWAQRARFGWVIGFTALWSVVVYAPVAHWLWGGGWLSAKLGALDFAGGLVVQTTAGVSALVAALLMGKRSEPDETAPRAPGLMLLGAGVLWAGWFALAGGSALVAGDGAASAIIAAHAAAASAALTWLACERIAVGKPTATGFATGAVAGLVTASPAAGYISPGAAMVLGVIAAAVCYPAARLIGRRLHLGDTPNVFAISGIGGITGSLLLAVFLSPALGGTGYAPGMGMAGQLAAQAVAVGAVALFAAVGSAVLALAVSLFVPMRVSEDAEREGLDRASHGESAWERA